MNNDYKIAGVITLYNPDDAVIYRINAILPFIEKLFVVDNSKFENENIINSFKDNQKVEYIFNNDNIGIAASMNIAIKKSIELNFDYLLTMDQDSEFENDSLIILISNLVRDKNIALYSPYHKNKFFTNPPANKQIEEVFDVMTSGNLLNLKVLKEVGFFREDYFIDYVDIEYCMRLRKNGYKIVRINNSILNHNEANLMKRKLLGKTVYPPNHKPFRWYFKIRNFFYIKEEYQKLFPEYFRKEKKNILNNILKAILFEPSKILKLKYIIKGFIDYKKNIKGKLTW